VYESLYLLNRIVQDLLVILEQIKKAPGMPKRAFDSYKVEIQFVRSHATQDVLEVMNDEEVDEMAKLGKQGKQKKANDDNLRDLDDVYFEVQDREEQRRKQGFPSLIGVIRGYLPPVSEHQEAASEPTSHGIQSRREIKSTSRTLRPNELMPKTRRKRASGRVP
jgi:hypothetical protein